MPFIESFFSPRPSADERMLSFATVDGPNAARREAVYDYALLPVEGPLQLVYRAVETWAKNRNQADPFDRVFTHRIYGAMKPKDTALFVFNGGIVQPITKVELLLWARTEKDVNDHVELSRQVKAGELRIKGPIEPTVFEHVFEPMQRLGGSWTGGLAFEIMAYQDPDERTIQDGTQNLMLSDSSQLQKKLRLQITEVRSA